MKVVNLFGGPNCGKSVAAAELFVEMKKAGLSVELVTEYAKDMVWEKRHNILGEQQYVFAKQHRRLSRLIGQVDWAITDSPLLFSIIYAHGNEPRGFSRNVTESFNAFDNINFFLPRNPAFSFHQAGRTQKPTELAAVDAKIELYLPRDTHRIDVAGGDYVGQIVNHLNLPIVRAIDVAHAALRQFWKNGGYSSDALQDYLLTHYEALAQERGLRAT
jgi:hypothetical protein